MGIKNLHRFLKKYIAPSYAEISLSKFSNQSIAIDTNVYLYKFKSVHKDKWINMFINFILLMKKFNMNLVFLYDTKSPIEKNAKKEERKLRRKNAEIRIHDIHDALKSYEEDKQIKPILHDIMEKYAKKSVLFDIQIIALDHESIQTELGVLENQIVNLTREDVTVSKKILALLGIPAYDSDLEAETLCAHLCYHKLVDAVLSEDTDVLVYGTPVFMTKINLRRETCVELYYNQILEQLNLTPPEFLDLCILSGTDYNDNLPNIGNEKAFKLIQKYKSLDTLEEEKPELNASNLNYKRVREIFAVPESLQQYKVANTRPDIHEFCIFASKYNISISASQMRLLLLMESHFDG